MFAYAYTPERVRVYISTQTHEHFVGFRETQSERDAVLVGGERLVARLAALQVDEVERVAPAVLEEVGRQIVVLFGERATVGGS